MVSFVSGSVAKNLQGNSQVEHHVNFAIAAVGAGLTGKNNDFLLGPILEPRQGCHGCRLEAVRFRLRLVPGADVLLFREVSIEVLFDLLFGDKSVKLTRW